MGLIAPILPSSFVVIKPLKNRMNFKNLHKLIIFISIGFISIPVVSNEVGSPFQFTLVDVVDKKAVDAAHVCIELNTGDKLYAVSDTHGKVNLIIPKGAKGQLVISKVGYETGFYAIDQIQSGAVLPLHLDMFNLDQVVVTGSGKPIARDSSIYKVKLIDNKKIEESGSLNLSELLMTEANIRMSTDLVLGSQIEMLGLSGQNVKIMIDGVPVIGRLDGNVDLSQINLANIAHVEVIEGPMSVVYGNNALAGTINLITKKEYRHNTEVKLNAMAEHVGRYAGNANVAQRFGQHQISIDGGYEYFGGYDFDNNTRSMDWKPKNLARGNVRYDLTWGQWKLHAKAGIYTDKLHYKSDLVDGYKAFDKYYYTDRYDFSMGANGSWNERHHLDVVASYNYYDRLEQDEYKDMRTLESILGEKTSSQVVSQQMFRAIYNFDVLPGVLSTQTGIDANVEEMKGDRISDGQQSLGDYAVFLNVRLKPLENLELQPGVRYAYNTAYEAPVVYSVNLKWDIVKGLSWRGSVASGFRAPNIKELHYVFVDSNHEIYGNPDLNAETSKNFNSSLEYSLGNERNSFKVGASAYYNDINDLITLIQSDNSTAYTYQNIEEYRTAGGDINFSYRYKNILKVNGGYALTARYNTYTEENGSDKYNRTHDWFAGVSVLEPKSKIKLALDYKYNGQLPYLYTDSEDNQIKEGLQDAYHTMNLSVSRSFLNSRLQAVTGVKNLFDVTSVNRMGGSSGAHSGNAGTPVSYGRSFFINITYKFNK